VGSSEVRLVLSLLFKKRKNTLEETVALIQQGDSHLHNELIEAYKPFIAKTVSSVCKRFIHESDDEFSIGLIAFNESIDKYQPEKGSSLLSFAEVIIKRRVIDYIRKNSKNIPLRFDISEEYTDDESKGISLENELSIENHKKKTEEEMRRGEIVEFQHTLKEFGLSFQEILEQSPKHMDARKNAMTVALKISNSLDLSEILWAKKRLPIKELESHVDISRKTIERNRKYIIAMAIILKGDYQYLKDYIKGVLET
jgi:RNA polymerase sigma factor